jgi:hypothetical protein
MHKFLARNSPEITHEQTLGGGVKGVIPNHLNHPPPPPPFGGPGQNTLLGVFGGPFRFLNSLLEAPLKPGARG